jgi:hypothetical protein
MANETFASDSVVDIKPYVPASWHPDYEHVLLATGTDTTGFVYDPTDQALVYRHKEGVEYPVTCRLAPSTNLAWKNYVVRDTIVVPDDSEYANNVSFGLVFYYNNGDSTYQITFRDSAAYLSGGGLGDNELTGFSYGPGDTLYATLSAVTLLNNDGDPSMTQVKVILGSNSIATDEYFNAADTSSSFVQGGYSGIWLDLSSCTAPSNVSAMIVKSALVQKEE